MKRAYHHGDLAAALLEAAVAQVRLAGIESVSLRGIAQAIGVSPAAGYHHFRDKEALMASVCQYGRDALAERFQAAIQRISGTSDDDAVDRFEAMGDAYIQFAVDEPDLFRLAFHPVSHMDQAESGDDAMVMLRECLDELDRRGMLRQSGARGTAILAWTAVHGFAELL
ncbi:MAG: TetR/AcrR family transcriptional regulator, partial [Thermomicrobiales bacterium]